MRAETNARHRAAYRRLLYTHLYAVLGLFSS